MAIHDIVLMGDPVLRQEAEPVPEEGFDDDLRTLVRDMFDTMYHAEGIGLAAPQIGISKRILVIDVRDEDDPAAGRYALVNPEVVMASKETAKEVEGCLSIPGVDETVERPWSVEVRARDPEGRELTIPADGLLARALQHEIDHLDGILFPDRISPLKRRLLLRRWQKVLAELEA